MSPEVVAIAIVHVGYNLQLDTDAYHIEIAEQCAECELELSSSTMYKLGFME